MIKRRPNQDLEQLLENEPHAAPHSAAMQPVRKTRTIEPMERMSLYAKPGDVVVFDGKGGYDSEVKEAKKLLHLGEQYQVESVSIGSWSSTVWVKGCKTGFNTVLFGQPKSPEDHP